MSPKTTVQTTESTITDSDGTKRETKQYRVTIPRDLAEHYGLEQGDEIEWRSGRAANKMELIINPNDE